MDVIPRVEDRGRHGAAESEFVWCTYQSNVHAGCSHARPGLLGGVRMKVAGLVLLGTTLSFVALTAPQLAAQADQDHAGHGSAAPAGLVEVVRNATRPFLDVKNIPAGYAPFLGCVSGTQEGAMGVHYVNGELVFDGRLEPDTPEAVMYEMRNGRLYLLGAEYIVMAEAWDASNAAPPSLLGQAFTFNETPSRFGLPAFYSLHVWAWRDNPNGTFVDWNPKVSCDGFVGK